MTDPDAANSAIASTPATSTSNPDLAAPTPPPPEHNPSSTTFAPASASASSTSVSTSASASVDSSPSRKRGPQDFDFLSSVGEGSYSTVVRARDKHTQKLYAVKILDKRHIVKEKKVKYVNVEKTVLHAIRHPLVIRLYYTFQDAASLYFVLELAEKGELLSYIRKLGAFDVPAARFYIAEVIVAIDHLHSRGVLHRDLKPENILLSSSMHVKLADFGSAKITSPPDPTTPAIPPPPPPAPGPHTAASARSFVGTAEYVSPELLNDQPAVPASDIWAIGCILYQLLAGRPPFKGANEYQTFQKITKLEYSFPDGFPEIAQDLIERILVLDPTRRISMRDIKQHAFFAGFSWDDVWKQTPPKLVPYLPAVGSGDGLHSSQMSSSMGGHGAAGSLTSAASSLEADALDPEMAMLSLGPGNVAARMAARPRIGSSSSAADPASALAGANASSDTLPSLAALPPPLVDPATRAAALAAQRLGPWHAYLGNENEVILRSGFVHKRKGLFSKKRFLVLTDTPRLIYIDADKKVVKGEIPWSMRTVPEQKGSKHFFVHTPGRTYYLECCQADAKGWVDELQRVRRWVAAMGAGASAGSRGDKVEGEG
ncbi:kinase-like domain-containing protein [Catenaria anguillulae PL171]|uniref:non-specific serine/threonine protein kinase n=1 Tax=Catenaria anguillulae PL171 TaxID=765915 RepID=A0A1Y2I3E6_9FUNG|nr:kinase-like domain-containing protein [Catenaria anguillulae PL171]